MPNGTVKFFNAAKGFGFITSDESSKDVFVPSASVTASGIAALKPGQRVSFEEVPDGKGPKAVNLKILAEAPKPVAPQQHQQPRPQAGAAPRGRLTFYHDHTSEWSEHVLEDIRAEGHDPVVVSYRETPPTKDDLRVLARLLQGANQSLVRRYDPLFFELQLDDRFIGESEFWDAIVEHPGLINGPLLANGAKAGLCHTDESVDAFFAVAPLGGDVVPVTKPKGLSERALRMMAGESFAPPPAQARAPEPVPVRVAEPAAAAIAEAPPVVREGRPLIQVRPRVAAPAATVVVKPVEAAKPPAKAKPAPKPKATAKPAPKAKATAKPAAKKPAKKK